MMKIIQESPPIRNFAPDIPVSLVNAVNKALQKDPTSDSCTPATSGRSCG